jgi:two-component system NtrC family sensor kinase
MTLQAEHNLADIRRLFARMPSLFIGLGQENRVLLWNARAEQILGCRAADVVGRGLETCPIPWDQARVAEGLGHCGRSGEPVRIDGMVCDGPGGERRELGVTLIPFGSRPLHGLHTVISGADITTRRLLEEQLSRAQKMQAIGHLAAGIAHEISTPAQFVGDNTHFLKEAFDDLVRILDCFQAVVSAAREGRPPPEALAAADAAVRDLDLAYLVEEIPLAIDHILDGVGRISKIVRSMKFFAHPGDRAKAPLDLNEAIESTIIISRNAWKYVADVDTDLDPDMPPVPGQRGEINQVLLNLITNAAHAIAEKLGPGATDKGRIRITSSHREEWAEIRIQDSGAGIPEAIRNQVFDLFFTTKEEGVGSGQGLAIAHSAIVEKHGGALTFDSAPGEGTTFIIRLPVDGEVRQHG